MDTSILMVMVMVMVMTFSGCSSQQGEYVQDSSELAYRQCQLSLCSSSQKAGRGGQSEGVHQEGHRGTKSEGKETGKHEMDKRCQSGRHGRNARQGTRKTGRGVLWGGEGGERGGWEHEAYCSLLHSGA